MWKEIGVHEEDTRFRFRMEEVAGELKRGSGRFIIGPRLGALGLVGKY